MNVLIIGGSGFLGKELNKTLLEAGFNSYTTSYNKDGGDFRLDIRDTATFSKLPNNFFKVIINCASFLHGGNYLDNEYLKKIFETNILGSQNICKWVDTQNTIRQIINCSTLAVINKPWERNLNEDCKTYPVGQHVLYASSKLSQELLFTTFGNTSNINVLNIRFSSIYGNDMDSKSLIMRLITQAKSSKLIQIHNGNLVHSDFLHKIDASRIILECIINKQIGIINAASGQETSIFRLANIIQNNLPGNIEIINHDEGEKMDNAQINIEKLKKIINPLKFIKIEDGISDIILAL